MLLQLLCNRIAVCLVHIPQSFTFLFVLVPRLAFSPSCTKWLRARIVVAVHRFYDQVTVGTDCKAADSNCDLLGIRGDDPQPACTLPSPDVQCMFVLRIGRLRLRSRRLSDNIHVHPLLSRSWSSLAGSQRSSDTRSCSGRSSCARQPRTPRQETVHNTPHVECVTEIIRSRRS